MNKDTKYLCNSPRFLSFEIPVTEKEATEIRGTDKSLRWWPVSFVIKPLFTGQSRGL